jgi:HK97 family phage prohead protease
MATAEIERRITTSDTAIEYREADNGEKRPVIVGYAAVFQSPSRNLGGFIETIHPRAFDSVLKTNPDVVGVFNHDKNMLLARSSNGTLRLKADPYGLRYEMMPPKTKTAEEVVELVSGGYVTGSSFAFAVSRSAGDSWSTDETGMRRREIREISLLDDVGPVVRPAYEASSVVVSRRAIEMALGESFRPNQTMANAARKGLRAAKSRDDYDQRLIEVAERVAERGVVSIEEVEFLAATHQRCHEMRSVGWSGSPAWVEWMLAGGDAGEKWVQRRSLAQRESDVRTQPPAAFQIPESGTTAERAEPDELSEGDFVSWDGGMGRVEHVMREGSIQGMTATPEAPLAVVTPYDDGEPEDYMIAAMVAELTKIDQPAADDEERAVNLRPTAGMAAAARRGLRLHEEGKSGDGLKPETVARANKIARREELTPEHVREMNAWFARHESASKSPGWDTPGAEKPGFVAWLLWSGNSGQVWSARKVAQMERESERSAPAVAEVESPAVVAEQPVVEPTPAPVEQSPPDAEVVAAATKLAQLQESLLWIKLHDDSAA